MDSWKDEITVAEPPKLGNTHGMNALKDRQPGMLERGAYPPSHYFQRGTSFSEDCSALFFRCRSLSLGLPGERSPRQSDELPTWTVEQQEDVTWDSEHETSVEELLPKGHSMLRRRTTSRHDQNIPSEDNDKKRKRTLTEPAKTMEWVKSLLGANSKNRKDTVISIPEQALSIGNSPTASPALDKPITPANPRTALDESRAESPSFVAAALPRASVNDTPNPHFFPAASSSETSPFTVEPIDPFSPTRRPSHIRNRHPSLIAPAPDTETQPRTYGLNQSHNRVPTSHIRARHPSLVAPMRAAEAALAHRKRLGSVPIGTYHGIPEELPCSPHDGTFSPAPERFNTAVEFYSKKTFGARRDSQQGPDVPPQTSSLANHPGTGGAFVRVGSPDPFPATGPTGKRVLEGRVRSPRTEALLVRKQQGVRARELTREEQAAHAEKLRVGLAKAIDEVWDQRLDEPSSSCSSIWPANEESAAQRRAREIMEGKEAIEEGFLYDEKTGIGFVMRDEAQATLRKRRIEIGQLSAATRLEKMGKRVGEKVRKGSIGWMEDMRR